ncbi:MAG: hypothetical protein GF331_18160 [Chitinivibrionales bacterium]|nr:hypothetical protein [Chitinivibrionales bacterium]
MRVITAILLAAGLVVAQPRFLLQSEQITQFFDGSTNSSYTFYTYDSLGNRTVQRVYDGVDSAAALMATTHYSYTADGLPQAEYLTLPAGDTISRVVYSYEDTLLRAAEVQTGAGVTRYTDSLYYGSDNLLEEQRRINSSGTMTYYHRYGYESGRLEADTLFDGDPGSLSAGRITVYTHTAEGQVATEAEHRKVSGEWYLISTALFTYEESALVSVATYHGDGSQGSLIDSTARMADEHGNCTLAVAFDEDRVKTCETRYEWLDTQPVGTIARAAATSAAPRVSFSAAAIVVETKSRGERVSIRLIAPDGRELLSRQGTTPMRVTPPRGVAHGAAVLRITGTDFQHTQSLLLSRRGGTI